ncbi:MAG: PKD domain-containing protein [Chitinophagaceae bacterium]|nr:MAG: PKD domain-containing protein [Chitinophagaceae bacterium]
MEKILSDNCARNRPFSFSKWVSPLVLLLLLLCAPGRLFAQVPYNYSTEGFDNTVFPRSSGTAPATLTSFLSTTGTWGVYKGYATTSSDPCPNSSTNWAMRFPSNAGAYIVTPYLAQGAGVVTFNDARTNRTFTWYTSTDDGATWSAGTTVSTGASSCATITIPVNNLAVNRMKFANMQTNDMGIDNLLITAAGINKPVVSTTAATGITVLAASSGGNVTTDGGATVSDRGVVWGTTSGPTVAANGGITHDGTGTGTFTSTLLPLAGGATYFYRAFASNSAGTAYGDERSFSTPPATPTLIATPATLAFGQQQVGTTSPQKTYSLQGVYLSPAAGNITVSAPAGYQVSASPGSGFGASVTLPYSGGSLPSTQVYVRFIPGAVGTLNGNIGNSGGGATATVILTGAGAAVLDGFTNVGFDFWTGFGYQEKMSQKAGNSGEAKLSIYISVPSGSVPASVVVEMPGIEGAPGFPRTVTVTPGTVTEVSGFPTGDASNQYNPGNQPDTRLYYTGKSKRGIHIASTNGVPISVWMHSYTTGNSAAGAMLFPTNTWASSYTVQAYGGYSNNSNPNSFFFVIAKEDNTPIWFTPSQDVIDSLSTTLFDDGHTAAMVKYQKGVQYGPIILNKGEVFNAMGFIQGSGTGVGTGKAFGLDLSGSTVKTSCEKSIAVFGGNGRVLVNSATCNATQGSDHMIQQMFPAVAWGKRYLTAPTTTMEYNLYRVNVSDPTTRVWVNNAAHTTPLTGLVNNLYYEFASSQPQLIESDKPITVTQFIVAGGCANANNSKGNGDPEMIILSPVEQAIKKTTVYSAGVKNPSASYNGHYINVVIPQAGVASFRLDGGSTGDPGINQATANAATCYNTGGVQPLTSIFKPHPQLAGYAYAQLRVSPAASHTLSSDSAFNAIAYGMGDGESYGYNAGASLKDLSQILLIKNPYGQTTGLTCKGNDLYFKIALPFAPTELASLTWDFDNNPSMTPNASVTQNAPVQDSSFTVDGIPYYVYKLPSAYHFTEAGTYSFRVLANALTTGGCTGVKIFQNSISVVNAPVASFDFSAGSCGSTSISFSDVSTSDSTAVANWTWNFGDGATLADTSHLAAPTYTYPAPGIYQVSLRSINEAGCFDDTVRTVDLAGNLQAAFTTAPAATACAGSTLTFTDGSTSAGTYGTINEWTWDFGDGSPVVTATNGNPQSHPFTAAGTFTVSLRVKTTLGCVSTVFTQDVTINAVPAVTSAAAGSICSGPLSYSITASVPGTTFSWSRVAVAGIPNAAVSGQTANPISEMLTNTTGAPVLVTYIITPSANGCTGTPFTYTVTVNPNAIISSAAAGTACSGVPQNYGITSNVTGATFSWSRAAVAGISNAAVSGQTSATIAEALLNTTNVPVDVVYSIAPSFSGCAGTPFTYTVTVFPAVSVTSAATATVCSNAPLGYSITGNVAGTTFSWSRAAVAGISNPAVSGQATALIDESLVNTGNAPVSVTYIITPAANGCAGASFTLTVTVNPRPAVTSAATGSICGSNPLSHLLTSNVAGATFTWDRAAVPGISNAGVSAQTANPISETLFNTTTSPIDVVYTIAAQFGSCAGAAATYTVTVNPTPVITSANTGAVCSGQPLSYLVSSTVSGSVYTWSRAAVAGISNGAVSGQTGNPISETLVNTSTDVVTVTYSIVTGFSGCTAPPFLYAVTVTPTPGITSAASATVCNGAPQNYNITSGVTGTTFSWSRAAVPGISNSAVSGQTSSSITEALVNTTNAPVVVTYQITPSANGCTGAPFTYTVTVNPTAAITAAATGVLCSAGPQNYSITSDVAGATFTWSRAAVPGISNAAVSGMTTASITEALVNTSNAPVDVVYQITPSYGSCAGTPFTYTVTVNPTATVTSLAADALCSGTALNYTITSAVAGSSFTWSRAATTGIQNAAVAGQTVNPITETLVNTGNTPAQAAYIITPEANGCAGTPFTFTVTVNPVPQVTSAATGSICSDAPQNYNITSNVAGAAFTWSRAAVGGISNAVVTGQAGASISEALINTTGSPVVVTYIIVPATGSCTGVPFTYDVTVHPKPEADFSFVKESECVNGAVHFTAATSPNATGFSWNFGDGSAPATDRDPVKQYSTGGSYSVQLTATTAAGCSTTSAPKTVELLPLLPAPVLTAQSTTSSLFFKWAQVTGATLYEVSLDGGSSFIAPNGTGGLSHLVEGLVPLQSVRLIVRATGTVSCQASSGELTATVPLPDVGLFVPNTISPNGDGKNDRLRVLGNHIGRVSMKVYTQWGSLIYAYEGHDASMGWDGTVGGAVQPVGVYAYAVSVTLADGRVVTKKGLFNLIR